MAGFGEAFSRSFENARQNRAVKERDLFKVAYDSYIDKKSSYSAAQTEWNKAMEKGQILAQKYGVQPEAIPEIAKMYKAGYSDSEVDDIVANSKFTVTPNTPLASDVNSTLPVDDQMTAAGLPVPEQAGAINNPVSMPFPAPQQQEQPTNVQTPNPMISQVPQAGNTDLLGGIFGPDGIFKNAGKSDMAQAEGQVMEQTGTTAEQMAQYNQGFQLPENQTKVDWQYTTPGDGKSLTPLEQALGEFGLDGGITDAKVLAANQAAVLWSKSANPKDQERAKRWEAMRPSIEASLQKDLDPEVMKLLQPLTDTFVTQGLKKADMISFAEQAREISDLGKQLDGVALTQVGTLVGGFEGIKREVTTFLNIAGELGRAGSTENDVINSLNQEIANKFNSPELEEIAQVVSLYTAAQIRLSYQAGRLQGQQGNGFSNNDFVQQMKSLAAGSSFKTYDQNLKNFVNTKISEVNNYSRALQTNVPSINYLLSNPDTAPFMDVFGDVELSDAVQAWLAGKETPAVTKPATEWTVGQQALDENDNVIMFKGGDPMDRNNWEIVNKNGR